VWYFAYGSNLCRDRLLERIASARYDRIACLSGHDFRFQKVGRDGSGKADAYPTGSSDDVVWGALVEVVDAELVALDRFEPGYDRREVEVELPNEGEWRRAFTYVAQPAVVDPSRLPFSWYRRLVAAGGLARGLPDEYLARIAGLSARGNEPSAPGETVC
jgi:hypothetical protein